MKFSDYQYQRPDLLALGNELSQLKNEFINSQTFSDQLAIFEKINKIKNDVETMEVLANIRNSLDANNETYEQEKAYFDENGPVFSEIITDINRVLFESKHKDQ